MTKNEWVKLAEAYSKEIAYWHSLYHSKIKLAEEHHINTDFIGNDYFDGPMTSVVEELLGEDFCYWFYDCKQSFERFNKNVQSSDGTHPSVKSLGDIYDFWKGEQQ